MTCAASPGTLLAGEPLVLLQADICRILRIDVTTLYRRIRRGEAPAFRRAGAGPRARYEWLRPDVERWLVGRTLRRTRGAA